MWVPESACAAFLVLQCHLDIGPLDTSFSKHFQIYRKKKTLPKLIHWNVIGSLSLYCWNSHLDIFVSPCWCRLLTMKTILICLISISTWNWQLWLESWFWSVLNKHRASSSLCFDDFRDTLYRKSLLLSAFYRQKPKLGNLVVYPEGTCDRVVSQFQITALSFILQCKVA